MVSRMLFSLALVTFTTSNVFGQLDESIATQPEPQSPPLSVASPTRAEFNELVASVRDLTKSVAAMKEDTGRQLKGLRSEVEALSDIHSEDRAQLEQLAKQDKNGRSYLRLDASHEDSRNEIRQAISQSVPKVGRVRIYNELTHDQPIVINDVTYNVIARSSFDVNVPLGDFLVRLPRQPAERRTVGLPNFATNVVIIP
jgi:hypothetical protein